MPTLCRSTDADVRHNIHRHEQPPSLTPSATHSPPSLHNYRGTAPFTRDSTHGQQVLYCLSPLQLNNPPLLPPPLLSRSAKTTYLPYHTMRITSPVVMFSPTNPSVETRASCVWRPMIPRSHPSSQAPS